MTQKEKAEAYDTALERAKDMLNDGIISNNAIAYLQGIFPELKESEDERIRKDIISHLKYLGKYCQESMPNVNEWIAWLEKQGKQTLPQTNEHAWLYLVSDVLTWKDEIGQYLEKDGIGQYLDDPRVQERAKRLCGEYAQKLYNPSVLSNQESADKVKPKFKVGDWVVTSYGKVNRVISVDKDGDGFTLDDDTYFSGSWKDNYHLWTIEDAKDGDVLAASGCIVIFKEIDGLNIKCHCTYFLGFNPKFYVDTLQNKTAFCPATKQQREILKRAITNAGYKWKNNQLEKMTTLNK